MIEVTDESRIRFGASDPSTLLGYVPPFEPIVDDVVYEAEGLLVDRRPARWLIALLAGVAGFAVGLVVALALIPEQPERILVPVEQPAPSTRVEPGVRA